MVKWKKLKSLNWGFTAARVVVEWKTEIVHSRAREIGKN